MTRAIMSVFDKDGIVELAEAFAGKGIEIISTGGTARILKDKEIAVTPVDEITGFPECLDGRVKTLHPKIHGGILARRELKSHMDTAEELGIGLIDYIVINLYPFKETILNPESSFEDCIENIDIGGPGMLRAGAKNHKDVTVLCDPADYQLVIDEINESGTTSYETRKYLAYKAFALTAQYDSLISNYLASTIKGMEFPEKISLSYDKIYDLRYGENPTQKSAFYKEALPARGGLTDASQLNGKELSYNNIADTDACIALLKEFKEPTVVAVKHANPCGVGSCKDIYSAWTKAYEADPVSIFGGIVAANRPIDGRTAKEMAQIFLEVIIAPDFSQEALDIFQEKKNLRVLKQPDLAMKPEKGQKEMKKVNGGILIQDLDLLDHTLYAFEGDSSDSHKNKKALYEHLNTNTATVTKIKEDMIDDMIFGMKVVKHVKSNAIVLVKDLKTVGIGAGQPNRVTSAKIAIENAGDKVKGSVLASDAFFPFPDTVELAAGAGVRAVIQPGGSIKDELSVKACDSHGIPMVFTGVRHFKH